jgi:hypothetical protein
MPPEPTQKRTFAFFDGQNLFYAAKEAFGYSFPNYAPRLLAKAICQREEFASRNTRGINKTDWIKIDRQLYDSCLDPNDYRPKNP